MLSVDVASFEQTIGCNRAERHCAACMFLSPGARGLLGQVAGPITNNSCVKCVSVTVIQLTDIYNNGYQLVERRLY